MINETLKHPKIVTGKNHHAIDSKYCHHMTWTLNIKKRKKDYNSNQKLFYPSDSLEGLSLCYAKFRTLCGFWCLVFGKNKITKRDGKKWQQSDHESWICIVHKWWQPSNLVFNVYTIQYSMLSILNIQYCITMGWWLMTKPKTTTKKKSAALPK